MFDIGWLELTFTVVILLLVIGPDELPGVLRSFGRAVARVKDLARDFQDGLDDIAHMDEVKEAQRKLKDLGHFDFDEDSNYVRQPEKSQEKKGSNLKSEEGRDDD